MTRIQFSIGQGYDSQGNPLADLPSRKAKAYQFIASIFGGFHSSVGDGGWMSGDKLVLEPDLTITTVIDTAKLPLVPDAATHLAEIFAQSSVLFTSEHVKAHFTSPNTIAA